ncbi:MAG: helix-turn-helix domain-containing protein [Parcubacteria group bacterium]
MREPWERLRWARMQAGWDKQVAAAESLGMPPQTYRTYERRPDEAGARMFDHNLARKFAAKFKVNWVWLLTGEGEPKGPPNLELQVFANKVAGGLGEIEDASERERAELLIWNVVETFRRRA